MELWASCMRGAGAGTLPAVATLRFVHDAGDKKFRLEKIEKVKNLAMRKCAELRTLH